MKTQHNRRYNYITSPGSLPFNYLKTESQIQDEVAHKKIRELVKENIALKHQIEKLQTKSNQLLHHNHKIVSIIAHDLRSPYNTLLGAVELLKTSTNLSKEMISHYLDMISDTTNNSLHLLDDLLDWAIISKSKSIFRPSKYLLKEIVDKVLYSVQSLADMKEISIINNVSFNFLVNVDRNMIETVLRNLISNAVQYHRSGGTVVINATEIERFVEIEVSDNGNGINKKFLKQLFFEEKLAETNETKEERWKGLGLLFSKEFIEMHGGKLNIETEEGKGTNVKFTVLKGDNPMR